MSFSLDDVLRIAHLARIELGGGEAAALQRDLHGILGLIEQLRAADTRGIEPMVHARDVTLRLREDAVTEADRHQIFQAVAPQVETDLYLVPKVIE
jgi:aspartyl-tRNA(Asn)/glutamyl-tRNA(Gln) amidotransferase subunit C